MKQLVLVATALFAMLGCSSSSPQSSPAPLGPAVIAVTPVGAVRGAAVTADVSASGGTLTSADGRLRVDVPAGAVATSLTLSVQAISNEAPGGSGDAYRLGPEGTMFATPVTVTFIYAPSDLVSSDQASLQIAYQDSKNQWAAIKSATRDDAANKISVVTSHFSDWSLVEGVQLRPPSAIARPSDTVSLSVFACGNQIAGTDELVELRNVCRPDPSLFVVGEWAANGVVNGNPAVGTIGGATDTSATFTAPATVPAHNPVTVSASTTDKKTQRKTVLVANVFVSDHPALSGTVNTTQKDAGVGGLVLTSQATVKMVWDPDQLLYRVDPSTTLTAHWDIVGTQCETHGMFTKNLGPTDGAIILTDVGYFPTGATMGTFVGTQRCGPQMPQPFMLDKQVEWWPVPMDAILAAKPDGSIEYAFVDQVLNSGMTVSANWKLVPLTK